MIGGGRRTGKQIAITGDLDVSWHCYYNGQSLAETRNGSDETLQLQVWGLQYVDEGVMLVVVWRRAAIGRKRFLPGAGQRRM